MRAASKEGFCIYLQDPTMHKPYKQRRSPYNHCQSFPPPAGPRGLGNAWGGGWGVEGAGRDLDLLFPAWVRLSRSLDTFITQNICRTGNSRAHRKWSCTFPLQTLLGHTKEHPSGQASSYVHMLSDQVLPRSNASQVRIGAFLD